jgi:hypothetical protein
MASLALSGDCEVDLFVRDGVVEISGTVPTSTRKGEILEALKKVHGVEEIETEIHVLREEDPPGRDSGIFHEEPVSEIRVEELMEEVPQFLSEGEESYQ